MATIDLVDVRKVYPNGVEAVKGIDLAVADGELIVLLGPSGCGKSTLLRMVAGLETVTKGEIRIAGARVNDKEPAARDIAMVFQNYALYPHMRVYDNMAYGLRNRRMPRGEIDRRVRAAAETLGLAALLERKPRQLSGGQRQRVAMGRAIVREPKAFLFDEPLSNLDAKLRGQVRVEIKRLQRRLGTTSLYVTHDQVEAMTLADRLVVMNQGAAEQIGTPDEIYSRPATLFVAGFIGAPAMNIVDGTVEEGGDTVRLGAAGAPSLKLDRPPPSAAGRNVKVGLRPEHLVPDADGPLALAIEFVENLGADALLYGRVPGGASVVARADGGAPHRAGETLRLDVLPRHVHLFEAESGCRMADSIARRPSPG
ncbi:MAG TPA: sn-glycerol-3-phosphate import ATP-binding protein UgpC [Alphaproteobacteria bacterium]|jgi:sn-glycerol 3-phosphate transport system ATP-binding protein